MKRLTTCLALLFLLLSNNVYAQEETFSDYFGSSEDYALRELVKETNGRVDTLLGRCVDSIFANNIEAVLEMSREIVAEYPEHPFGYLMRSVAWADLDNPTGAMEDIDRTIELAPEMMIGYTMKSRYYLFEDDVKSARRTLATAAEQIPNQPDPPFLLGALDYREGHTIKARKQWEESVARDSCYSPARVAILAQRAGAGRLGKGVKELESLLNCENVSPDIFHLLAVAERYRNNDERAMEHVNVALDLDPGKVNSLSLRSKLYTKAEKYVEAVEDLYDVFAGLSSPRRRIIIATFLGDRQEKMEGALNYYMRHQGTFEKDHRYQLAKQLIHFYSASEFDEKKVTREALSSSFDNEASTLYFAALCKTNFTDDDAEIMELFDAALARDPNIPDIYRIKGKYYLAEENYREAYAAFRLLSEQQPNNKVAFHGMATVLQASGRTKAAVNLYNKVLAIDSTDVEALLQMGDIGLNNSNYKGALHYYSKYVAETDDQATVRHNLAVCHYMTGDMDAAGLDLAELSDYYLTNNKQALNLRGLVRLSQDSLELALADFNQIIFRDKTDLDAHYNRAQVYHKMQDWRQCIANLNLVLEQQPDNPFALYDRAIAKFEIGQNTACADLQRAIELGKEVPPEILGKICGP